MTHYFSSFLFLPFSGYFSESQVKIDSPRTISHGKNCLVCWHCISWSKITTVMECFQELSSNHSVAAFSGSQITSCTFHRDGMLKHPSSASPQYLHRWSLDPTERSVGGRIADGHRLCFPKLPLLLLENTLLSKSSLPQNGLLF